jgi:hypothetical protein
VCTGGYLYGVGEFDRQSVSGGKRRGHTAGWNAGERPNILGLSRAHAFLALTSTLLLVPLALNSLLF